ncbi:hypothetical protein RHMOL_Rhmol05G0172300 [Rhododendron molle]|uniref:Uncharacterized protein n=1 Tax=Rhododendron molle TaxID=49168 RepID=A0ACC0NS28_RHOML|nr:hypothetical protein RHMOL_Rhmol05G0172300 [Rhododendron molle]
MGPAAGKLYFDFGISLSLSTTATASNNSRCFQQQPLLPPPQASVGQSPFLFPSSPLPFGCFLSPQSSYPLLSSSLLFSP